MDDERIILKIIQEHDRTDQMVISRAYGDGGLGPLFPRLIRASGDQLGNDHATMSRYGIWANTVRDNIRHAYDLIGDDNQEEAKIFLIRAINSLSAFSEIQALQDRLRINRIENTPGD